MKLVFCEVTGDAFSEEAGEEISAGQHRSYRYKSFGFTDQTLRLVEGFFELPPTEYLLGACLHQIS